MLECADLCSFVQSIYVPGTFAIMMGAALLFVKIQDELKYVDPFGSFWLMLSVFFDLPAFGLAGGALLSILVPSLPIITPGAEAKVFISITMMLAASCFFLVIAD